MSWLDYDREPGKWDDVPESYTAQEAGLAAEAAKLPPFTPFSARADAEIATIPAPVEYLTIDGLQYKRDVNGTALTTGDGATWAPVGTISPRHFGAAGDGVTDDTAAFNAALEFIRDAVDVATEQRPVTLYGGRNVYLIAGSINATGISAGRGWTFRDVFIKATGQDKTVVDFTGSRFLNLDNVSVRTMGQSDTSLRPWCGILLANSDTTPCAHITMNNVSVDGYFKGAALQNCSAEEVDATKCLFWNRAVASGGVLPTDPDYAPAYAAIFDGRARLPIKSDYATQSVGRTSFTMNNFVGCAFQKPFGIAGPTVYMSDLASSNFEKPYMTAGSDVVIEWLLFDDFSPYAITFDGMQVETTGVKGAFSFLPQSAAAQFIYGLKIRFGNAFCEEDILRVGNAAAVVVLRDFELAIDRFASGVTPLNGVIGTRSLFALGNANLVMPDESMFGLLGDYGALTGQVYCIAQNSRRTYGVENMLDGAVITERLTLSTLPVYADNAAAVTGGLANGRVYKTVTGELRIVI